MTTSFEIGGTTVTFDPDHEPERQFESDIRERVFQQICYRIGGGVWESEDDNPAPNACVGAPMAVRPIRVVPVDRSQQHTVAIRASVMNELADKDGLVMVSLYDREKGTTTEPVVVEAAETVETTDPLRYGEVAAAPDPVDETEPQDDELVYLIRPEPKRG